MRAWNICLRNLHNAQHLNHDLYNIYRRCSKTLLKCRCLWTFLDRTFSWQLLFQVVRVITKLLPMFWLWHWCFSTYARAKMPLLQFKYSLCSSFSINLRLPILGTRWGRSAITQNYYHSADTIVLVYNIGAAQSFSDLPEWLRDGRICRQYHSNTRR